MPTVGGNSVSYGSNGYYQAQVVYSVDYISDTQAEITITRRVYHSVSLYDSSNNAGSSGLGSESFGSASYSSSSGGYKTYKTSTHTITREYGTTKKYTVSMWVEGLADGSGGGARSTASTTISVNPRPYTKPSKPGTPSADLADNGRSAYVTWTDPSDWGGDNTSNFDLQIDDNNSFSSPNTTNQGNNDHTYTGQTPGSTRYLRVRAKNEAGAGDWSNTRTITFNDYPGTPQSPVISNLKSTSADMAVSAPASNGGATITGYHWLLSPNSDMSSPVVDVAGSGLTTSFEDLDPSTEYFYEVTAINAVGESETALSGSFTTKSAAVIQKGGVVKQITDIFIQKDGVPKRVTGVGVKDSGAWRY